MNERKLTLEVIVDQDSKDWWPLFDTLKSDNEFVAGVQVCGARSGWTSEEIGDALVWTQNAMNVEPAND